jgi:hypothetical protein
MRADIHDGPERTLQSEAGYIDARPYCRIDENLLHRTAGPYIWVNRVTFAVSRLLPVYLDQRTPLVFVGRSRYSCAAYEPAPGAILTAGGSGTLVATAAGVACS